MGRFYKTHTRWMANPFTKKAAPVIAVEEEKTKVSGEEEPEVKKAPAAEESVVEVAHTVGEAPAMTIEKENTDEGIVCEITAGLDYDEIRYNIGSKKVTEKNRSRCKLYEGKFILEESAVVNASAFKEGVLIASVQG